MSHAIQSRGPVVECNKTKEMKGSRRVVEKVLFSFPIASFASILFLRAPAVEVEELQLRGNEREFVVVVVVVAVWEGEQQQQ